ncbi:DUF4124 domain-containing protein [Comamonas sp. JUb58]|uniref:DUF4124 domain-containing protein n=1 Tax=Comamonas sp. JUb58 TaxID=2485114 RepID=UPI001060BC25|nr:DUF4124 domain-containing protein [Comamonas sp. JUb58]
MKALLVSILLAATGAHAQVVYKCANGYTDKPCKDGQELDIRATEGAHSMSGAKRQSTEALVRDINRQTDIAMEKGIQQYRTITACNALYQERMNIDRKTKKSSEDGERRFQIRQEQFKLKCKNT